KDAGTATFAHSSSHPTSLTATAAGSTATQRLTPSYPVGWLQAFSPSRSRTSSIASTSPTSPRPGEAIPPTSPGADAPSPSATGSNSEGASDRLPRPFRQPTL